MNPKLDVRHLRVLAAVAQYGSVTKASRQLNLTQSALSHQLRDAEEKLGYPLFARVRKQMVLTPAGELLLGTAQRILKDLTDAEGDVQDLRAGRSGVVRLSTECYTCYHWLPSVLTRLHETFPRVQVRISAADTRFPIAGLIEGRLDLAIVSSEPTQPDVAVEPLFDDELVLLLPKGHRLSKGRAVRPKDLDGERIIVYPPQRDSYLLNRVMLPAGARPSEVIELPLTEAIVELVRGGFGIGFMARWAAAPHLRSGAIKARGLADGGFRRRWSAATLRNQPLPPYTAELIRLLKSSRMPMRYLA